MLENLFFVLSISGGIGLMAWYVKNKLAKLKAEDELLRAHFKSLPAEESVKIFGEILTNSLKTAAQNNTFFGDIEGVRQKGLGDILVEAIPYNAGSYSIFVSVPDTGAYCYGGCSKKGHAVMQIDLRHDSPGEEIQVTEGSYGPARFYPFIEQNDVMKKLVVYLSTFKLYNDETRDNSVFREPIKAV